MAVSRVIVSAERTFAVASSRDALLGLGARPPWDVRGELLRGYGL